jgi:Protein of unknown function (DUF2946)
MRWFRQRLRHGSWLALVALAINFSFAFGHVHGLETTAGGDTLVTAIQTPHVNQSQQQPANPEADYLCPICIAASALGNAMVATPPALPTQFAEAAIERTISSNAVVVLGSPAAFQSRAPPIS